MNTETTTVEQAEESQKCPVALINKREGQTFEEFRAERAATNKMIEHFLKGVLFHDSMNETYDAGRNQMKRILRKRNGTHKKVNKCKK